MEVINIKSISDIKKIDDLTICLGFFDAFHLGHIELIKKAKEKKGKVGILSFSSNPRELLFNQDCPIINNLEMKEEILNQFEIDYFFILDLSWEILNLTKDDFINKLLVPLGVKNIVCGFDNSFGKEGKGHPIDLINSGLFHVDVIDEVKNSYNQKISSTLIHSLIKEGKIEEANSYLFRPYLLRGKVINGFHIGRTIQFPTANIFNEENFALPKNGVYATVIIIDDKKYHSMTNVGIHPTINQVSQPVIETYVFDYGLNIYNKNVKLIFYKRTRDEIKFDSLDQLKKQLEIDEKEIKNYLINIE